MNINAHCVLALFIRVCFILFGYIQDSLSEVNYTDIDYKVFTDAAQHVTEGRSPFLRPTYRYTPILSFMMVPNILIHDAFGKLLFCLFDVLTSILIHNIQRKAGLEPEACKSSTFLWLYNPLPIVISTRGSADSLVAFLVVLCIRLTGRPVLMGLVFGLAVHFKIYPCIYALSFYLTMSPFSQSSTSCNALKTQSLLEPTSSQLSRSPTLQNDSETQSSGASRIQHLWLLLRPSRTQVLFVAMSTMGFLLPTLISMFLYKDYLQEAILYHLTRKDIRHNFSPFFYPLYLLDSHQDTRLSSLVSFAGFILQGSLVAMVAFTFPERSRLPECMFAQTALFVSLNKVCTSQYFLWYLCLLPLAYPLIQKSRAKVTGLLIVWAMGQVLWLATAYYLEFEGRNTFFLVFVATLVFFSINVYLVCLFIKHVKMSCTARKSDAIKID